MYRFNLFFSCYIYQIHKQLIRIKWRKRRKQFGNNFQTCIQCLICAQFICAHFFAPETFSVKTNIPIAQVIINKRFYQASGFCRIIIIHFSVHILYKRMKHGQNPSVYFWTFFHLNILPAIIESVNIGIKSKE